MNLFQRLKAQPMGILGPVIGVTLFAYFGLHTIQGDRGLIAWYALSQQADESRAEHARLSAFREKLEKRVSLMNPDGMDPDLLEERVRTILGYVHPDDVVVFLGRGNPGAASSGDAAPMRAERNAYMPETELPPVGATEARATGPAANERKDRTVAVSVASRTAASGPIRISLFR